MPGHSSRFRRSFRGPLSLWLALLTITVTTAKKGSSQVTLTPFEAQSVLAFNPNVKVFKTLTLSGTATWIAGSLNESGNVSLTASIDGSTSEQWTLPTQSHTRTESSWIAGRSCTHTDKAGKQQEIADPSCFRGVPWFAPWMGFTLLPSAVVLAEEGTQATDTADGVVRFNYLTNLAPLPAQSGAASSAPNLVQQGSAVAVLYDHTIALPSSLEYDYMINSDNAYVIKYRIVFSDYRVDAGLVVPHRIQRYLQRTLQADITINTVTAE